MERILSHRIPDGILDQPKQILKKRVSSLKKAVSANHSNNASLTDFDLYVQPDRLLLLQRGVSGL
jgi:hypothetical protein